MTPKACSLYDWIKIYEQRKGYAPCYSDLSETQKDHVQELINNGWIKIIHHVIEGIEPIIGSIKVLK